MFGPGVKLAAVLSINRAVNSEVVMQGNQGNGQPECGHSNRTEKTVSKLFQLHWTGSDFIVETSTPTVQFFIQLMILYCRQ